MPDSTGCGPLRSRPPLNSGQRFRFLLALIGCGALARAAGHAQPVETRSSESTAKALKNAIENEPFNQHYGPVQVKTSAGVGVNYADNIFYSYYPSEDVMIEPEADLDALWPITQLNALRLSLGLSYEEYLEHSSLNSDAPLVNPGSELAFNVFAGNFHLQPHEKFSYQQSLFFNNFSGGEESFYNFSNVGTFSRLDNEVGLDVTWSLKKAVVKASYNHENFISRTAPFDYLDRSSEWFTAGAGYVFNDHLQAGLEGRFSLHDYSQQTFLNNNWRGRVGPFLKATLPDKITLRVGAGYDTAQYQTPAALPSGGPPGGGSSGGLLPPPGGGILPPGLLPPGLLPPGLTLSLGGTSANDYNSDYSSYYAYARISQELRLFTHSLEAGRELLLGYNANNLRTVYVRYAISTPIIRHLVLGANASVNVAEEYGGPSGFDEKFTYYDAGPRVEYHFAKHWRADLNYEFLLKESDLALRDFHRNQVGLDVVWSF